MHFCVHGGEWKPGGLDGVKGERGSGVDREYNLFPAVREVGFSQQAVGMIPGVAQCGERDHRDDIPTLLTVSHRVAKPTATNQLTVKSPPGLLWVHHSGRVGWKREGKCSGMDGSGKRDMERWHSEEAAWLYDLGILYSLRLTWYLWLFFVQLHLSWLCHDKLTLSFWASRKKYSFCLYSGRQTSWNTFYWAEGN